MVRPGRDCDGAVAAGSLDELAKHPVGQFRSVRKSALPAARTRQIRGPLPRPPIMSQVRASTRRILEAERAG